MPFIVEDGTGLITATSYLSVADFKIYHTDRSADFSAYTDDQIQSALIKASDYIDRRFVYKGYRSNARNQALEWPRHSVLDPNGNYVDGDEVPVEIGQACAELSFIGLSQTLIPNMDFDTSGGFVTEQTDKLGTMVSTTKYSAFQGRRSFPQYTIADSLLRKFAVMSKQLARAS